MKNGYSPQKACEEAIKRIVSKKNSNYKDFQVAYIAINKKGETGSYSIHKGFSMTKYNNETNQNYESDYFNN
jgi:N4-(beta-N-acetylglucosaminyl)-L-asparaginase